MIPEEGQGKDRIAGGLGPLFSGLIAATLIALTLAVAVALGLGEQALIARVEPTATEALAPPALTLMPLPTYTPLPPTYTPLPATEVPLPDALPSSTPADSPTPLPTLKATKTRILSTPRPRCIPPNGYPWRYTWLAERGDTLYSMAIATGTTTEAIQKANCMGSSTTVVRGKEYWVPKPKPKPSLPTRVPTYTPPPTPTGPTSTPTATLSPTPTFTPGPPTDTPTPVPPTNTPPPTKTPTPVTPTNTATPVPPTKTPVPPTNTPVPPPTKTPTNTPEPEAVNLRGFAFLLTATPAGAISPPPLQEWSLAT